MYSHVYESGNADSLEAQYSYFYRNCSHTYITHQYEYLYKKAYIFKSLTAIKSNQVEMEGETSSTPGELIGISDDDESVASSIFTTETSQSFDSSLKYVILLSIVFKLVLFYIFVRSWTGPIRKHSWGDLPKCIKFIAKNGCGENCSAIWMQRTLDRLSPTATPEQLIHILNGYADLYKLVLYIIWVNDNILVDQKDIRTYCGTSSKREQAKRHRNVAYIMYNSQNSIFAPLYTTHEYGHSQTCFASDDERINDDIASLLRQWNQEGNITKIELVDKFILCIC